ncbi:MAG TPA: winged helix-turn-helix domain-containing protein [Terriglobales bacterium]|nr:winged helix-turn-helix domain-containing protein [Terriglobales bacterium]
MGESAQTVSPVRFGVFELDSRAGELRKGGIKVKLEGKPFQVLSILLERPGEVITREELQEKIWPDTFVDFEHNLNTAIKKIRDVLGDAAESPRFVETLPRRGYRFIAPVNGARQVAAGKDEVPPPRAKILSRLQSNAFLYIAGVIVVAVVATVTLVLHHRNVALVERSLRRLTFDDGLQFGATWSPDGRFLAYSSDKGGKFDIWVQQVSGGDPVEITRGPGENWQADWSPDGKYIAYRSEAGDGGLFIIPALGGAGLERKISDFGYYPHWSPDGSEIVFQNTAMGTGARFYVIGLDGSAPREILPEVTSASWCMSAAWHPDGKRVSIWVWEGNANPMPILWTAPIDGGKAVRTEISPELLKAARLVAGDFTGWGDYDFRFSWAPTGDGIYFERTIQRAKNIWRMAIEPATLRAVSLERITTGVGPDSDLAVSRDAKQIAFTGASERVRGWAFPFKSKEGREVGPGRPVTLPGIDAWQQALTRDGKNLAFAGKRSGRWELWVTSLATGQSTAIAADDPYERNFPQWSPDGTRLAYMRGRTVNGETQIAIWSEQTRSEVTLTTSRDTHGKFPFDWSPDGKWLLTALEDPVTHHSEIWRLPADETVNAELLGKRVLSDPKNDLFQAKYSPDGQWITFERVEGTRSTVYVVPASGGSWLPITDGKHWADKPRWSADGRVIYFLAEHGGFFNLWGSRFDPRTGKTQGDAFAVTSFTNPRLMMPIYIPSIDISITRDVAVLTMEEKSGSIWILEN